MVDKRNCWTYGVMECFCAFSWADKDRPHLPVPKKCPKIPRLKCLTINENSRCEHFVWADVTKDFKFSFHKDDVVVKHRR